MDRNQADLLIANKSTLKELFSALAAAQAASAAGVEKGAKNDYHRYQYATAEAIIEAANKALTANGLAVFFTEAPKTRPATELDNPQIKLFLVRRGFLCHSSGGMVPIEHEWPIVIERGRPLDKAMASAATSGLSYYLRDLLLMPRVDPADDMDHESRDQKGSTKRKPAPRPTRKKGAPAPEVAAVAKATNATLTKAKPPHDSNWEKDRRGFCAVVEKEGFLVGKVMDWCEEIGKGRPSWWTTEDRRRFVRDLKADKIQPPQSCAIPPAKK